MISILLKASFVLGITLLFYKLILQQETFFSSNRWYLVACLMLTCSLPFVTLPHIVDNQGVITTWVESIPNSVEESNTTIPPTSGSVNKSNSGSESASVSWTTWLIYAYVFGVVIFAINLLLQIVAILWKVHISKDNVLDGDGCLIINTKHPQSPCSFFHYIFIHPDSYEQAIYEKIIAHEKIHAQKGHSWDLLFAELAVILLWFNPLAWMFKTEVEKNLEFQTDQLLLKNHAVTKKEYQLSLVQIANPSKALSITTNYNQSLLKNRIAMMNSKISTPHRYWKYAFVFPLVFGALLMLNKPESLARAANPGPNPIPGPFEETGYNDDCSSLLGAVKANNLSRVEKLLESIDPNCEYRGGGEPRSPLVAAARKGNMEIVQALLSAGADVEYHAGGDEPPLMAASANGHVELVRMLLKEGAKVNRVSASNGTALLTAARSGHQEVVQLLISNNAKVNVKVSGDGTALIQAVRNGHFEISKLLLEQGADPYLHVPGDEYAMYHARVAGDKAMIKLLERYGSQ